MSGSDGVSAWEAAGYGGSGNVASLIGSLKGRSAIVCGGAEDVFEEFAIASSILGDPVVFAANDVGIYLDSLDHWVSLEQQNLPGWIARRRVHLPGGAAFTTHAKHPRKGMVDYVWEEAMRTGYPDDRRLNYSGLFGMEVAYRMGAAPIVLCGCPASPRRRFFDEPERRVHSYDASESIRALPPEFRATVRSMSGWTREFFGAL